MPTVLHLLSQRPGLTGSGITLEALVREATRAGWEQMVSVGIPESTETPVIGDLKPEMIRPLKFESEKLPFPVPGMSDVMPYPSLPFSQMTSTQIELYREAWRRHIANLIDQFRPDVIHSHHLWIMSSLIKDIAPSTPLLIHCHATGLRQMKLCPQLRAEIIPGLRSADVVTLLHEGHRREVSRTLGIPEDRICVVGAGYREDIFYPDPSHSPRDARLVYVGKLSHSKGVPQLIEAFRILRRRKPGLTLDIAGSGAGKEGEKLEAAILATPGVHFHGQLEQEALAQLMRKCRVCVLPSFYEGLPLVLVEALACGCRLVATSLPGILQGLKPQIGPALELLPLPEMESIDRPQPAALEKFVKTLAEKLEAGLSRGPLRTNAVVDCLDVFRWRSVFGRVELLWKKLCGA